LANLITLFRLPLLVIYIALLYTENPTVIFLCVPLIIFGFLLDTADGVVARARGEVTLTGSALDIAVDRIYETVLWVVFADMDILPIVIPIIVIMRGILTDAVRAIGMSSGESSFEQVKNPLSRFLVSSPYTRGPYGFLKGFTFAVATALLGLQALGHPWSGWVHTLVLTLAWITITFTIVRGLPVLIEGLKGSVRFAPRE
jgi:phosphatidylglycerophosphate synthase